MQGVTLSPLEKEFLTHSNYIEGEDENIDQPALAWDFLRKQTHLSNKIICATHKILMLDKPYPAPRGYYRSVPQINVYIGRYTPPSWWMVDGLMTNWTMDYKQLGWREAHIRFETIHPFADGNGRIGRMLMNWQRRQIEHLPLLIIHEGAEQREYYTWFKEGQK